MSSTGTGPGSMLLSTMSTEYNFGMHLFLVHLLQTFMTSTDKRSK